MRRVSRWRSEREKAEELLGFGDWPGPEGQGEQFAALWGVG
ncbi:MAG: hypothetical protein AAFZ07_26430 [Actinomycetota bacterium]